MDPLLPVAVLRDLQNAYSRALYDAEGQVNLSTIRVLWPSVLSADAREALHGFVVCEPRHLSLPTSSQFLYYDAGLFLNSAALWLNQPRRAHAAVTAIDSCAATTSHSWVEATHCYFYNWGEHVHAGSPMFWFAAAGSGLWINLGSTLVVEVATYGSTAVARAHKHLVKLPGAQRGGQDGGAALRVELLRILGIALSPRIRRPLYCSLSRILDAHSADLAFSPLACNPFTLPPTNRRHHPPTPTTPQVSATVSSWAPTPATESLFPRPSCPPALLQRPSRQHSPTERRGLTPCSSRNARWRAGAAHASTRYSRSELSHATVLR